MRQIDALKSPRFAQVSTFARLPLSQDLSSVKATFIGIPFDTGTSYRPGARFGPMSIRQSSRILRPYNQLQRVYPFEQLNACDYGDIDTIPGYIDDTIVLVRDVIRNVASKSIPFIGGGDHLLALPTIRALHDVHGKFNLLHLDSHYDFWDNYWGKKLTHGTWLRRALEEKLLDQTVQVGIRSSVFSEEDMKDLDRLGIQCFDIRDIKYNPKKVADAVNTLKGKTYVSLDIDVADPAFAPGTGTPEPGGLTSFELLEFIRSLDLDLACFDVVEVSPPYDFSELTSFLASAALYEGLSLVAKKS
jgi:agmatinase